MSDEAPKVGAFEGIGGGVRATALDVRLTSGAFAGELLLGIALLSIGALAYAGSNPLLRYSGVLVLGWLGLQVLWSAILKNLAGPVLRMDARGISHALLGEVRWQDVGGIAIDRTATRKGEGPFLALGLLPGAEVIGAGLAQRALNARGTYRFSLRGMDHSPAQILQHAIALRDRVSPPRLAGWRPGMSPPLLAAALQIERDVAEAEAAARAVAPDGAPAKPPGPDLARDASRRALKQALDEESSRDRRTLKWLSLAILVLTILVGALNLLSAYLRARG